MDEEKILAQEQSTQPPVRQESPPQSPMTGEMDLQSKLDLYNYLDVDMSLLNDQETNRMVDDIISWGNRVKPGQNRNDIIFMIQEIRSLLGQTDKSPLQNVWEYITLDSERRKITNQMKLMEK